MNEYNTLFEDDDDIIAGSPRKRYWDITSQVAEDKIQNEFDKVLGKIAALELMLIEQHHEDEIDSIVATYQAEHPEQIEQHKKNLYLEYAAKLIFAPAQND